MVYWGCIRVTGSELKDLTLRNTPPNGVGRTGMLWTGEWYCLCCEPIEDALPLAYRVVSKGIELFRFRYPGLVHYFHTRTGMWEHKKKGKT